MFDRVDKGEVWPEGGDEFGEREETVERVEALIDIFMVDCFYEEVKGGRWRDEVFYMK